MKKSQGEKMTEDGRFPGPHLSTGICESEQNRCPPHPNVWHHPKITVCPCLGQDHRKWVRGSD